jgi:5-methyltetrahydrofolate--homocysteine methyltransferase
MKLEEIWGKGVICLDGAMGTMIQKKGITFATAPEYLNISHPNIIQEIHRAYVETGAHIIETNTFGGSKIKLANYSLQEEVYALNKAGVELAKRAAEDRALVAASMGPTGKFLEPVGDLSFSQAVEVFKEQAIAFKEGEADLVMVETMSDIKEAKAAITAVKEATNLPVFASATFQEDLHTLLGMSPEAVVVTLEAMGVWALGANCSLGPQGILEVAKRMASVTSMPLVFMPNAGLPHLEEGQTVFPATPQEMAQYAQKLVEVGAWAVGGCCGSTPNHIREIIQRVKGMPIVKRETPGGLKLAGRKGVVFIGDQHYPIVIGERINPTGKKDFQGELRGGRTAWARDTARDQVQAGADLVDINVGMPGIEEEKLLPFIATGVQTQVDCPLVLDSSNPQALEAALQQVEGKALINSMSGEESSIKSLLPLAHRYGAALLLLPLDETGIPPTPEERVNVALRLIDAAFKAGIPKENLIVDGLTMTVGAQGKGPKATLETVRAVKKELGLPTVLGVSNVSFGLPFREAVNSAFLAMALEAGLDAAIINPNNPKVMESFHAGALLAGRDPKASRFLKVFSQRDKEPPEKGEEKREDQDPQRLLFNAILYGDEERAKETTKVLLKEMAPLEISNSILIPAMEEVGRLFESNEYFLPQVMASASAMQGAFALLKEVMKGEEKTPKGTVIMATVKGDVHDIGKNIVGTLLENHGFQVIDLGKNVPKERIVAQVQDFLEKGHPPDRLVVGLSALMTTTMTEMKRVIQALREKGVPVFTIVGGAVVTPEYAQGIGAHYAKDAVEAVKIVEILVKEGHQNQPG